MAVSSPYVVGCRLGLLIRAMADQFDFVLELKAVDTEQRLIDGYAAVFGNLDQGGDVIEPGAFTKTLAGRDPASIPVFIGHRQDSLPVGEPVVVKEDGNGLFTRTRIYSTPEGDSLLAVAKQRLKSGAGLGMSIGYGIPPGGSIFEGGKHRLKEIDLGELSYVARPMNPKATIVAVKASVDNGPWDGSAAMASCDTASCFESICAGRREGDPDLRSTWALPHHDRSGAPPNAAAVRNSLARFDQTEGLVNRDAARAHLEAHMRQINPDYEASAPAIEETKAGRTISRATHDAMMADLDEMAARIDSMRTRLREGAGMDMGEEMSALAAPQSKQQDAAPSEAWLDLDGEQMA